MADQTSVHPIKKMLAEQLPREVPPVPSFADYAPARDRMAEVQAAIDVQLKQAVEQAVLSDPIDHIADMILLLTYGNAMIIDRELKALFGDELEDGKIAATLFAWATQRAEKRKAHE